MPCLRWTAYKNPHFLPDIHTITYPTLPASSCNFSKIREESDFSNLATTLASCIKINCEILDYTPIPILSISLALTKLRVEISISTHSPP